MTDAESSPSVCFVCLTAYGYFDPDSVLTGGGAERQLYLLSQELKTELDVHFVVGDYGQPRTEQHDGVTLHRAYHPDSESGVLERGRQFFRLADAFRRAGADLYATRGVPRKAIVVGTLARLFRKKWVYNVASDEFARPYPRGIGDRMEKFYAYWLRDANGIITQTRDQQQSLLENYGVESTVVPNGYPPAEGLRPHDAREAFLWVGRIEKSPKRPHLYLDLAESIPTARFRIAAVSGSDPTYQRDVEQRAAELENVRYLGAVPPDDIHGYYRDAIALVNTSVYEGFSNTFLEAWRYDTPVISLDVDPGRLIQHPMYPGYADGSFETLVSIAERLSECPADRRRLSAPTHRYFDTDLRMDSVADQYCRMLQSIID